MSARRRGGLEGQLVLAVVALYLIPAVLAGGVLALLYRNGSLADPWALALAAAIGLAAVTIYAALVAHGIGRSLVRTIREIRHGTELMATVNPDHRLRLPTGDELELLAEDINRIGDQLRAGRDDVQREVERVTGALDRECRALAAVLADVSEGVLLATVDAIISLGNPRARALLGAPAGGVLGRSLFAFIDRSALEPVLTSLRDGRVPAARCAVECPGGVRLDARVTPFADDAGHCTGFILALQPAAAEAGPETGRHAPAPLPLAALVSTITSIGSLLDNVLADVLEDETGRRHRLEMAREEVERLGRRLTGGDGPPAGREGAGARRGAGPGPSRETLYDFSLMERLERPVGSGERERRLDQLVFVVLDTETTGLQPERGDEIVSIAAVRVRGGVVRRGEAFDTLVQPGRPIPAASARVHGITDAAVAGAPLIDLVLPAFLGFAAGAVLVGHEVWFDLRFLDRHCARLGLPSLAATHPVLDARLLSMAAHGPAAVHNLDGIAARLGVVVEGRHSALGDALVTADILARLLDLLRKRGVLTLGDALDATRRARGRR